MMRILVTGAQGYLGGAVSLGLERRGIAAQNLVGRLGDIAPRSLAPDVVLHCAGALAHRPTEWMTSNYLGTQNLLRGLTGMPRIVFVSSRSVYPRVSDGPVNEDMPIDPQALGGYGRSKLLAEQAIAASGYQYLILRVSTLFGVGGNGLGEHNFPAQALRKMWRGEPVSLFTPDRVHDYLCVRTLANAIVERGLEDHRWNEVHNVSGPVRGLHASIELLAAMVAEETGRRVELRHESGPLPQTPLLATARYESVFGALRQPEDATVFGEMIEYQKRYAA